MTKAKPMVKVNGVGGWSWTPLGNRRPTANAGQKNVRVKMRSNSAPMRVAEADAVISHTVLYVFV